MEHKALLSILDILPILFKTRQDAQDAQAMGGAAFIPDSAFAPNARLLRHKSLSQGRADVVGALDLLITGV